MRSPTATLGTLAVLLGLAGCGDEPAPPPPPAATPTTPAPTPTPTPPAPTLPTVSSVPSEPSEAFEEVTVVGTVVRADAQCVVLEDANALAWQLLSADGLTDGLVVGDRVKVVGTSRPDDAAGCDAIPLAVSSVLAT